MRSHRLHLLQQRVVGGGQADEIADRESELVEVANLRDRLKDLSDLVGQLILRSRGEVRVIGPDVWRRRQIVESAAERGRECRRQVPVLRRASLMLDATFNEYAVGPEKQTGVWSRIVDSHNSSP